MDKCPFCGAELFWSQGQTTEYKCNTLVTETGLGPTYGMECLKRQIINLKDRIKELKSEVVGGEP